MRMLQHRKETEHIYIAINRNRNNRILLKGDLFVQLSINEKHKKIKRIIISKKHKNYEALICNTYLTLV